MEKLVVTLKTVTPLFLGGAEPNESAELRAPSIKGAMRFWYRTMKGNLPIDELNKKEAELFGGMGQGQGQSKVQIIVNDRLKPKNGKLPEHKIDVSGKSFKINIIEYLGYGLYDTRNHSLIRQYIPDKEEFTIVIKWKTGTTPQDICDIKKTLLLLCAFGGLGSRNRNGFGCLNVKGKIDDIENCDEKEILKVCKTIELADFTAFSKESKLFKMEETYYTWDEALASIGKAYKAARESIEKKHTYDLRQCIASPIIVSEKGASVQKSSLGRHAKPYFMHVKTVKVNNEDKYEGRILFLPYKYCDKTKLTDYNAATTSLNNSLLRNGFVEVKLYE